MTEQDFLAAYDPAAFTPLAVAVDVALFTTRGSRLHLLCVRRREQPARGRLSLPGAFVGADEELDAAARRALRGKAGVDAPVRQFQAFGRVGRDPRMRVVSIAYMALLPFPRVEPLVTDERQLLTLDPDGATLRGQDGRKQSLAFDHGEIVAAAVADLRTHLDHSAWAFGLLPPEFALRELQEAHEAVRGRSLNKPAFRKRLLESGRLEPTGRRETNTGFRPAELYRSRENRHDAR